MNDEVLSGLKVLVAVAKADGVIHENEWLAIENALLGVELPEQTSTESLLSATIDLDAELALITTSSVKRQTFESACAMAYVDGEASPIERELLEKVRAAFALSGDQVAASARMKDALERAFAPLAAGDDAFTRRDVAIDDEIQRFSVLGAALASVPLPAFCEGVDLTNDVRMARKIGAFYGHKGDPQYWKTLVNNVVGSAGSWFAVSLLARLGATGARANDAYASTFALGHVTKLYFEKSEAMETDRLRAEFKSSKKRGFGAAKEARTKVDDKKALVEGALASLNAELASKTIDESEYVSRLASL